MSFQWDKDMQREGDFDPRRLLVNASTPYTFLTRNPEADENIARRHPKWPCCQPPPEKEPPWLGSWVILPAPCSDHIFAPWEDTAGATRRPAPCKASFHFIPRTRTSIGS